MMNWVTVGLAAATLLTMAVVLSYILGWANQAFAVVVDPRVEAIAAELPGANCGGCGCVGCGEYAEAVAAGQLPVDKCTVGGQSVAEAVAGIMGVEVGAALPFRPVIHCGAHLNDRLGRHEYLGEMRCSAANLVTDVQGCIFGCLGFGDCRRACQFDAIQVIDGLATVDYDKCVGCGACAAVCPRNIISMTPFKTERVLAVTCSNKDAGRDVKAVCTVGCLGCKACSRVTDLFKVENNLSVFDYERYDIECFLDVEKACQKCPRHRLVWVGKPQADGADAVPPSEITVVEPDFKTTVDDTEWRG